MCLECNTFLDPGLYNLDAPSGDQRYTTASAWQLNFLLRVSLCFITQDVQPNIFILEISWAFPNKLSFGGFIFHSGVEILFCM